MPLVAIVMATYFPDEEYFREQLKSLNEQSYEELELIVCDDSADETQFEKISKIIQEEIFEFPFRIIKNEQNIGSNNSFEKLTKEATSEYIAYADQDDIWHSDKIEKLVSLAQNEKATLVYSDLRLIDDDSTIISESMLRSSFRMKHVRGDNTFGYLIQNNSVTGAAMLIRIDIAKAALPLPDASYFVHDHWLAIAASANGTVSYSENPLVDYRIHENNQVGTKRFHNLETVDAYVLEKISLPLERLKLIESRFELDEDKLTILNNCKISLEFRLHKYNGTEINKLNNNVFSSSYAFERVLFMSPRPIQNIVLKTKNSFVKRLTIVVNRVRSEK